VRPTAAAARVDRPTADANDPGLPPEIARLTEPDSQPPAASALTILVVDDEMSIRKTLAMSLEVDGHRVVAVSNGADAVTEAARQAFDMAFVDLRLGATSGADLIPELLAQSPWTRVVIITAHGSIDAAVDTVRRGAADFLTKPFTPAQVRLVVERVAKVRALERRLAGIEGTSGGTAAVDLDSGNAAVRRAVALARQAAATDATVLLRGESGTGKGVMARAIHLWSGRRDRPFATVSCPTLSPQLLESELFGHMRGAFTGAVRDNPGRVAACDGGTLFLDEIGDLPLPLQPKLLRFVQDREYERVGESRTRHADVRLVTATNVDLEAAVRDGRFREDLLYRVNVVQVDLPPLRDRPEDVPRLAAGFLTDLARGRRIVGFTPEAMAALQRYRWPGNIRELRNVVERAVILCQGEMVGPEHLPAALAATVPDAAVAVGDLVTLDRIEELHVRRVLARTRSLDEAATVLGIDLATLWRRRKKYGI
jgi:NtrC-family two-component system response regulator AlgB